MKEEPTAIISVPFSLKSIKGEGPCPINLSQRGRMYELLHSTAVPKHAIQALALKGKGGGGCSKENPPAQSQ